MAVCHCLRFPITQFHPATRQDLIRQDRHKGFQNQQETNAMPNFDGQKRAEPKSSQISLDVNLGRPSPVHIQAGKSAAVAPVVTRERNARSLLPLRSKNGRTLDDIETPRKTVATRRMTPPKNSPQSSSNRDSTAIDRAIRPPSHVDTTRYHVSLCMCELCRRARLRRTPGPPPPPMFKIVGSEPRLVSATLQAHGFKKQGKRRTARGEWRLLWSSQHLR